MSSFSKQTFVPIVILNGTLVHLLNIVKVQKRKESIVENATTCYATFDRGKIEQELLHIFISSLSSIYHV